MRGPEQHPDVPEREQGTAVQRGLLLLDHWVNSQRRCKTGGGDRGRYTHADKAADRDSIPDEAAPSNAAPDAGPGIHTHADLAADCYTVPKPLGSTSGSAKRCPCSQCDDPRDQLKWGNGRRTWPYNADFWCVSPTRQPRATARPTAAPRPTVARYPTATPAPDGLPVLHAYDDGELLVAAYVTWNDNSYIGAGTQLFQMKPGSGSICVSTYHAEVRSFGSWPPECHFEGQRKPYTVEVDFQGTTYLAVPVHYEENPFSRSSGRASEEPPWGEIFGCSLAAGAAAYTGDVTLLAPCIELMEEILDP